MIKFIFLISALVFFAKPTIAHDLKLELVDDIIQVNAGFHGDKLSILGTKMQDTNILISVQGPPKKIVIRKKEKIWGAWVNKSSYVFEQTPSFYRVASNLSDLSGYMDLLSGDDALLASSLRKIKSKADSQTKYKDFEAGLKDNMQEKSLYDAELHDIEYINNDFFRWDVYFPANVPTLSLIHI